MNEVIQTILNRRSCKQYLDRPVPEELLDQVLLAGTYAANGRGDVYKRQAISCLPSPFTST